MYTIKIPLFPLKAVLFPGGRVALRIFEPRYLDMVSRCLKEQGPFGVCLIREGREAGQPADPFDIGTLARIVDWHRMPDGLLGIVAEGGDRFSVRSTHLEPDRLLSGEITIIPSDAIEYVPPEHLNLVELLREAIRAAGPGYGTVEQHFEDAAWVGFRLAELLPLDVLYKQRLLELSSPMERLRQLQVVVSDLVER